MNEATSSCNCPCQQSPSTKRTFAEKVEEFFSEAGHQNWEKAKLIFKGTSQEIWKAAKDYWKKVSPSLKDRAIKEGEKAFIGYLNKQKEATEAQNIFYEVAHRILTGQGATVASEPSSVKRTFVEKANHLFSNFGKNILKHADQALSSAGTAIKKEAGQNWGKWSEQYLKLALKQAEETFLANLKSKKKSATGAKRIFYEVAHQLLSSKIADELIENGASVFIDVVDNLI